MLGAATEKAQLPSLLWFRN